MRKKLLCSLLATLAIVTLGSCAKNIDDSGNNDYPTPNPNPNPISITDFSGYEFANNKAVRPTDGVEKINIFGINDFHGAIKEYNAQMGLGYLGSYIKQKTSEPNTLFIDSGDSWQGSLESNYNNGKLINEVFDNAHLSARVVGNHDFDWGLKTLANNVRSSLYPTLAANVFDFDWENKEAGTTQQNKYGESYATYVLDNGIKVGIIGTIGKEQITSITSTLVKDVTFVNETKIAQEVSDFLRVNKHCDIVVLSTHASFEQTDYMGLTQYSDVSNKRYVDLVFNAHTHKEETFKFNGVSFAQFGGYGEIVGEAQIYFDFKSNQVLDASTNITTHSAASVKSELNYQVDEEIQTIIDKYDKVTKDLGSQVLSTNFSGPFYSSEQLPNLMAEAMALDIAKNGYQVDFAYVNYGRASHYSSTMTYSDLYNIFPFDNDIVIIKVSGKEAANMLRFRNNIYKVDPNINIDYYHTYTVVTLDYIAFHCDINRNYDNFPNIESQIFPYQYAGGSYHKYRDVLVDYLLDNPEKTFDSSYYSFSNPVFSREASQTY